MKRLFGAPGQAASSIFPPNRNPILLPKGAALLLVIAIVVMAAVATQRARAAGPAMSISPASAVVATGSDVTLDIDAADISAPGIGGYVVTLSWDPSIVSLTSLTDAGWVTGGSLIVFCSTPTIDNVAGVAELDCTPLPIFGEPGVTTTTPHVMVQAVFHGEGAGATAVTLNGTNTTLLDNAGNPSASTISNGSLTSGAGVGGVAREPDQAELLARGERHRDGELPYGATIVIGLAIAGAGGAWVARRRRHRDTSVK